MSAIKHDKTEVTPYNGFHPFISYTKSYIKDSTLFLSEFVRNDKGNTLKVHSIKRSNRVTRTFNEHPVLMTLSENPIHRQSSLSCRKTFGDFWWCILNLFETSSQQAPHRTETIDSTRNANQMTEFCEISISETTVNNSCNNQKQPANYLWHSYNAVAFF